MDRKEFSSPINADIVKKYYAWGNQKKWIAKVENPEGRLWQIKQKKRFKAKTRKGGLNHTKKREKKRKKKEIEKVKLKTWKGGLTKERGP